MSKTDNPDFDAWWAKTHGYPYDPVDASVLHTFMAGQEAERKARVDQFYENNRAFFSGKGVSREGLGIFIEQLRREEEFSDVKDLLCFRGMLAEVLAL